jgi:hypothetical protein
MKVFSGYLADSRGKAEQLALQQARVEDMDMGIIDMFASITNNDRFNTEADKIISSTVRNRYGNKVTWRADKWYVPIPGLRYDGNDIPQLVIEVNVYLVATAFVRTQESRMITLAGNVGKPEIISLPMIFLHALLEDDLERFTIVARDTYYTTYGVPGTKPIRLPNDFVDELNERLKLQSVVSWLWEFGDQGRYVAPLVAGNLIGLAFRDSGKSVPSEREIVTTDTLISALEGMAYRPDEAREMVKAAAPRLRADTTLEEAIRITLQNQEGGR